MVCALVSAAIFGIILVWLLKTDDYIYLYIIWVVILMSLHRSECVTHYKYFYIVELPCMYVNSLVSTGVV